MGFVGGRNGGEHLRRDEFVGDRVVDRLALSAHRVIKRGASQGRRSSASMGKPNPAVVMGAPPWRSIVCGCRMAPDFLAKGLAVYWNGQSVSLLGALGGVAIIKGHRFSRELAVAFWMSC